MTEDRQDSALARTGTVATVQSSLERCDYCRSVLPPAKNHNGVKRRFCAGNRCRSAWHDQAKRLALEQSRRAVEAARVALASAIDAIDTLDGLLKG